MVLAVRRNSPWSGRSSISRAIVCDRSPWATAPMTRAVSLVGWTRSSIRSLTESTDSLPGAAHVAERGPLAELALLADDAAEAGQLLGHPLVQLDDLVEGVGHLAGDAGPVERQADDRSALLQGGQRRRGGWPSRRCGRGRRGRGHGCPHGPRGGRGRGEGWGWGESADGRCVRSAARGRPPEFPDLILYHPAGPCRTNRCNRPNPQLAGPSPCRGNPLRRIDVTVRKVRGPGPAAQPPAPSPL